MNLVEQVRSYLGQDAAANISDSFAESPQRVEAGLSAAVPTLLSALAEKSARPDGVYPVARAVRERDSSVLERFPEMTQSHQIYALMERGSAQFTNLFGREASDGMAHAISRFSGL